MQNSEFGCRAAHANLLNREQNDTAFAECDPITAVGPTDRSLEADGDMRNSAKEGFREIQLIYEFCQDQGIPCELERLYDGYKITFILSGYDIVQHSMSYGGKCGYVEPAIGSFSDYTAVKPDKAIRLIMEHRKELCKNNIGGNMYYKTKEQCRKVIETMCERRIISPDSRDVHPEYDDRRGEWYISVVAEKKH